MRPKRLVMQAFGPFLDRVEIDFEAYNQQGLFLITGPTGSGKSSIFNAISYALYDKKADGSKDSHIKSDFANSHQQCFVQFEFSHLSHHYSIYRRPEQQKYHPSRGSVTASKKVQLEKDGRLLTDLSNNTQVNHYIEGLLGLSHSQFNQIVLLPQGQFEQFLISKSSEKEEIFRSIFHTHLFESFQKHLDGRVRQIEADYQALKNQIKQSFEYMDGDRDEDLDLDQEDRDLDQVLSKLEEDMTKNRRELSALEEEASTQKNEEEELKAFIQQVEDYLQLKEEKAALDKKIEQVRLWKTQLENHQLAQDLRLKKEGYQQLKEKYDGQQKEYDHDCQLLDGKEKELAEKQEAYQDLVQLFNALDADRQQLQAWQEKERKLQQQQAILSKYQHYEDDNQQLKDKIESLEEKEKQQREQEQRCLKELADIADAKMKQEELMEKWQSLKEDLHSYEDQAYQLERYEGLTSEFKSLQEELEQAEHAQDQQAKTYHHARVHFHMNMAGLLAKDLDEDQPCPVCGSLDHPQPAQVGDKSVDQESLEELERNYQESQLHVQSLKQSSQQLHDQSHQLLEAMGVQAEELDDFKLEQQDHWKQALDKKEELQAAIEVCQERLDQQASVEDERQSLQVSVHQLEKERERAQTIWDENLKHMEEWQEELRQMVTDDQELDLAQLQDQIKDLASHIEKTNQDYYDERDRLQQLKADIQSLSSRLTVQAKHLKEGRLQVEKAQETYETALEESPLDAAFDEQLLSEDQRQGLQEQVSSYQDKRLINSHALRSVTLSEDVQAEASSYLSQSQEQLQQTKQRAEEIAKTLTDLRLRQAKQEDVHQLIQEKARLLKDLDRDYRLSYDLASTANGKAAETANVSFERYVLGIYLDEILQVANQLLDQLTDQQFQLIRLEESDNRQGHKGLDISVLDRYSQSVRPATALSGGEKFKASLSLAIAMSQVIQERSAGDRMEALFIDEGFGTLDQTSINQALDALKVIQEGGRMIGLISHVSALKQVIPQQIQVEKTKEGSYLKQLS